MREAQEDAAIGDYRTRRPGSAWPTMIVSSDGVPHTTIFASPDGVSYTSIGVEKAQPAGMAEAAAAAAAPRQIVEEEVSAEDEEDGLESRNIEIVISQTNCSRAKAVKTLRENNNNLVNAIMSLSYGRKDDIRDM